MKNEVSDKDFLKNVCYIKHFYLTLHSIIDNYGKEYIRKDDAEGAAMSRGSAKRYAAVTPNCPTAAIAPAPTSTRTWAHVIGAKSTAMNGTDARHENTEKNSTMSRPATPFRPSACTQAYAPPAHTPPANPHSAGNTGAEAKPGLTTHAAPKRAPHRHIPCPMRRRSPRNIQLNATVKNGASLLSIIASARGMREIA